MPRPIWSGAISMGLVNVPVKLFSAVSRQDIRFNQLHDADGARIQMKRVCSADGEEVGYEHIVKGYEMSPGRYVVIDPEELDALAPEASRTIEILDFVDGSEIDPIYYDHPYYLLPDRGAEKAYTLLLQAMRESGRVAVARMVMRTKGYLAAVRAAGPVLALTTMLYAEDVVAPTALDGIPEEAAVGKRELAMAHQLIESLTADFDPAQYRDEYRDRVIELINQKAEGQQIVRQPAAAEPSGQVVDLMAALEASLADAKSRRGDGKGKDKAKAAARSGSRRRSEKAEEPAAEPAQPRRRRSRAGA